MTSDPVVRPANSAASAAGRPVMIATVPATRASRRRTAVVGGPALASAGSSTIGARVPSKSSAMSDVRGRAMSAARPARPDSVAGSGRTGGGTGSVRARRPDALAPAALPPQARHQDRVELGGLGPVNELIEQLVIPGDRHAENLQDLAFLGASQPPPAPLEGQNAHIALGQVRQFRPPWQPAPVFLS